MTIVPAESVEHRYKITLAYDGSDFHGWQRQKPPDASELRTVQQVIEDTLIRLLGLPITLVGASRTDAGVHAEGQVAHFDAVSRVPVQRLAHAVTGRLPDDVEVRDAVIVPNDFHAIRGAKRKQYRYRIHNASPRPLGERRMVYHHWDALDVDLMNAAATRLVGTHDVEGFSASGHGRTSTVRTIFACHVEREHDQVIIIVEGDGFLYNMVRIIAGTLVEVGRGQFPPEVIDRIIETADRRLAGPTLPASGLCLQWIEYELSERVREGNSDEPRL